MLGSSDPLPLFPPDVAPPCEPLSPVPLDEHATSDTAERDTTNAAKDLFMGSPISKLRAACLSLFLALISKFLRALGVHRSMCDVHRSGDVHVGDSARDATREIRRTRSASRFESSI